MSSRTWSIVTGDAREILPTLKDESIDCVVTSPPYWALRDYGTGRWEGGDPTCQHKHVTQNEVPPTTIGVNHVDRPRPMLGTCSKCGAQRIDQQMGLEETPELYVEALVGVFREVRRVLKAKGTLWLNLGDTYAQSGRGGVGEKSTLEGSKETQNESRHAIGPAGLLRRKAGEGLKPKDLVGIPWMVAFALRADGWWLRQEIIWCLSGGAWVWTRLRGRVAPMMVKDITKGRTANIEVWNGERWTHVVGWKKSSARSGMHITLRSGERIGATAGHRWPTQRGLLTTDQLRCGDVIDTCSLPDGDGPVPGFLTTDLCWFAGLYLAEGSRAGRTVQISLHRDEERWVPRLRAVAEHLGGSLTYRHGKGKALHVRMYGAMVNAFINMMIGGRTARKKHPSTFLWQLPNPYLKAFAQGYLDGDGCKQGTRIRLGFTRNYALERDLRILAARLGATIRLVPWTVRYQGGKKPAFRGEWRWTRSGYMTERSRSEVVSIRPSRARAFWDIEVEDEPHLFALASGVLTHNSKLNAQPENVIDRPTRAHEQVFLLTKSETYDYDADAIREMHVDPRKNKNGKNARRGQVAMKPTGKNDSAERWFHKNGRNARTVWSLASEPFHGAHFATMPTELVRPCVLAGCPKGGVVLDPFCGAGTVGVIATRNDRCFLGIELNPDYADLARQRIYSDAPLLNTARIL